MGNLREEIIGGHKKERKINDFVKERGRSSKAASAALSFVALVLIV